MQVTDTGPSSSLAVGASKFTATVAAVPVAFTSAMVAIARSASDTTTRKIDETVEGVSSESLALQVTLVVPIGNIDPDA